MGSQLEPFGFFRDALLYVSDILGFNTRVSGPFNVKAFGGIMKIEPYATLFILAVIIAYALPCESQTTDATFVKKVSGFGVFIQTIQTADGAYVSLSKKGHQRVRSFVVIKSGTTGQKIWQRTISFQDEDTAPWLRPYDFSAIAQASDGGYILAGSVAKCRSSSSCEELDTYGILLKLRSSGDLEWTKEYTLPNPGIGQVVGYHFYSVVPVPDGGFIATFARFFITKSVGLVKFTSAGDVVWIKSITNTKPGLKFQQWKLVPDSSNFMLICSIENSLSVMKLNASGGIVWKKLVENTDYIFYKAAVTTNNELVIATACNAQICLVQFKGDGSIGRSAKYSLSPSSVNSVTDLIQTPDGGYAITGYTNRNRGFLLKINSSLQIAFLKEFNARGNGLNIFPSSNGGYLIFGSQRQGLLISRMKSTGTVPGCNFFHSATALRIPFGQIEVKQPATREVSGRVSDISINNLSATSVASSQAESVICQ
jgi:hypothetical protein